MTGNAGGSICASSRTIGLSPQVWGWREPCRGLFIAAFVVKRRSVMGKYVLGWLLGVPVVVLVIIYLFMH